MSFIAWVLGIATIIGGIAVVDDYFLNSRIKHFSDYNGFWGGYIEA